MTERSFTEESFFFKQTKDDKSSVKEIIVIDASSEIPDKFDDNNLYVLRNYKSSFSRGRPDPLKGKDVLVVTTPKGPHFYDLGEAISFSKGLYTIAGQLKEKLKEVDEQNNDDDNSLNKGE